ncbi:MAG: hypothetical protein AAF283_10225, partial [Cyanobacteria bacterium P01_A01_bin.70]
NAANTHESSELTGMAGLKAYLAEKQDDAFHHFNRKLLGYVPQEQTMESLNLITEISKMLTKLRTRLITT